MKSIVNYVVKKWADGSITFKRDRRLECRVSCDKTGVWRREVAFHNGGCICLTSEIAPTSREVALRKAVEYLIDIASVVEGREITFNGRDGLAWILSI